LKTKLFVPLPRPGVVPRPRLLEQLNQGIRQGSRLILVSAPAGFGKTTLLGAWLAQLDAPVGWYSLDESDNDPVRFFRYLGATAQQAVPGFDLPAPPAPVASFEPVLVPLINQLAGLSASLVLVLDDYHLIANPTIDAAIDFLLDRAPSNLHLVIATRADLSLSLPRLRARQQLLELRAADLRFTQAETAELLQTALNVTLSPSDLAALDRSAEGWIAALQLAALSLRSRQDASGFVQALSGSQRYILDYLVAEVLQQQTEAVRSFLIQTAILERLNAPLCDAVLANPDLPAQPMLAKLERANLFLVPLDQERRWYRYHRLFRDFLRARLDAEPPDLVPLLHRRAAAWYAQDGSIEEAIHHALAAQDYHLAASLIGPVYPLLLQRGEVTTLQNWIEALPQVVRSSDPVLALAEAWTRVISMDLEHVESCLAQLEGLADAMPQLSPEERAELAGEILTLRAACALPTGDVQATIEYAEQALAQLPAGSGVLRSVAAHNQGNAYSLLGQTDAASAAFMHAIAEGRRSGNHFIAISATFNLGELRRLHGRWDEAQTLYREALEWAESQHQPPLGGIAQIGLGLNHWDRWELDPARHRLKTGIDLARQTGAQIMEALAAGTLATLAHHQGQAQQARAWLNHTLALTDRLAYTEALGYARLVDAQCRILSGDMDALAQWLADGQAPDRISPALSAHLDQVVAQARLLLGDARSALDDLSRVRHTASEAGWTLRLVEALVLEAQAYQELGNQRQALSTLQTALEKSWPERFARPFAQASALHPLLPELARSSLAPEPRAFVEAILTALDLPVQLPPSPPGLLDPLTDRELDVLRLLPTDLSTAQIADQLVSSYHTVRTHLKHIYSKLDAHSRHEAVTRARDLGLL
jgi:LuxR family maltose regulon positive regulatory protein